MTVGGHPFLSEEAHQPCLENRLSAWDEHGGCTREVGKVTTFLRAQPVRASQMDLLPREIRQGLLLLHVQPHLGSRQPEGCLQWRQSVLEGNEPLCDPPIRDVAEEAPSKEGTCPKS